MTARTYGKLELLPSWREWVMTGLEPHVAIRLKQLFPRVDAAQTDHFKFNNDQTNCADLFWLTSRYPLAISVADAAILQAGKDGYLQTQAELERILTPDYNPPTYVGLREGQVLRRYQAQAIELLMRRFGLLLGDDLGLGKTYTAAGLFLMTDARPAVAVVQTHLQDQWEEKLTQFTTLRVHKIKSTRPYNLPDADVYIFKYSQLLGWVDFFKTKFFKSVAFDEVQELRTGSESGKGAAAYELSQNVTYRLGLSATPIYGYGVEIWNILRCIDETVLSSREEFLREWTSDKKHVNDPEALGTSLREQYVFLRRTKKDVRQEMPPVNRIVEQVEVDQQAMDDIAALATSLAMKVTTGDFMERGRAARELDLLARHATGVSKAKAVAAYTRILLESNVPVLLLGWHRDVYDIWLKDLADFNPVMFTGSESKAKKREAKRAFLAGESNLFIMSLRSGAGLDDLQRRCSTVIFGELDWSQKVMEQVIGRLYREGQLEQVTAIFLNSPEGSDPPMLRLLGIKASESTGIIDPGQVFEPSTPDDSRIKALAEEFLKKRKVTKAQKEELELA